MPLSSRSFVSWYGADVGDEPRAAGLPAGPPRREGVLQHPLGERLAGDGALVAQGPRRRRPSDRSAWRWSPARSGRRRGGNATDAVVQSSSRSRSGQARRGGELAHQTRVRPGPLSAMLSHATTVSGAPDAARRARSPAASCPTTVAGARSAGTGEVGPYERIGRSRPPVAGSRRYPFSVTVMVTTVTSGELISVGRAGRRRRRRGADLA